MALYLIYHESRSGGDICHHCSSDDPYPDREDEVIEWNLISCHLTPQQKLNQEMVNVNFKPENGQEVYVLYVRYSDGDTFGRVTGCFSIIGIYEHLEQATKVKESILDGSYKGNKYWDGYFSELELCEIEKMIVW